MSRTLADHRAAVEEIREHLRTVHHHWLRHDWLFDAVGILLPALKAERAEVERLEKKVEELEGEATELHRDKCFAKGDGHRLASECVEFEKVVESLKAENERLRGMLEEVETVLRKGVARQLSNVLDLFNHRTEQEAGEGGGEG